jgi:predicted RNA-binding Zn-ribbon protein involved in translation (DUF1610 family)
MLSFERVGFIPGLSYAIESKKYLDVSVADEKVSVEKLGQKFCPRCRSPRLMLRTALASGISPILYVCEDCGYRGPIFLEADNPPKKRSAKKSRSNTITCSNCGYRNPSDFKYCGKCGTPLGEEETVVY